MTLLPRTPAYSAMQAYGAWINSINNLAVEHTDLVLAGWNSLWHSPFGLTPQQAGALWHQASLLMDKTALDAYTLLQAAAAYLNDLMPGTVDAAVPPQYTLAWNQDGSPLIADVPRVTTSLTIRPTTIGTSPDLTQQFTATAFDQFGQGMNPQPAITWSAASGTIDAAGNYTAGADGSDTVTATVGTLTAQASVTIEG